MPDVARSPLSFSSIGDNTAIAAVTGKKILIHGIFLVLAGSTTVQFKSGSTVLTGAMTCAVGVPFDQGGPPSGGQDAALYACGVGEAFIVTLGGAQQCSGSVWYSIV